MNPIKLDNSAKYINLKIYVSSRHVLNLAKMHQWGPTRANGAEHTTKTIPTVGLVHPEIKKVK